MRAAGILADLRTVSSMNLAGNEWNPAFTLGSYYNGGTYGVGVDRTKVNYECIFFNKNIAKKYGLGDFYELVMNKEWTYEKFFEISQEVYRKSNRQITGMFTFQQEKTGNFVFANDTSPAAMDGNRVIFNSKDPKLLRALDFLQQYSRMGGMDLDKYERFGEIDANQVFTDGKCLFYTAWSNLSVMLLARNMKDDFGMLPLPMGPDAKNYKGILWGPYFCSLANDDPAIEDSAKILVAFCNRTNVPIKQIDQQVAPYFRDDESLQMLHLMMTSDITVVPGANYDGPLKNYYQGVIPQVVLLQQTPQQALESVAKSVQTSLDSYYGN